MEQKINPAMDAPDTIYILSGVLKKEDGRWMSTALSDHDRF